MILLAPLLIALGMALSCRLKVFVLIPATIVAWALAVFCAQLESFSIVATLGTAFLYGACLQFGYLAGGVLLHHSTAQAKKHTILAARR